MNMNLNFVFSKSMNLNFIFSKSMNLNFVFSKSMNLNILNIHLTIWDFFDLDYQSKVAICKWFISAHIANVS